MTVAPSLSGPLLRMHFHDCFIRTNGPYWDVETGRRDGKVSLFTDPINPVTGLPPFSANITALKQSFALRGLSTKHLVVLSGSFKTFDDSYYKLVTKRKGLLQSDAALLNDPETRAYLVQATSQGSTFFEDFGVSMVKMGQIGVLTGSQGEVRKLCTKTN
ncbi:hypothetical protein L1987_03481 [Smallanthus sonchifolius]|uniref:Uncharacterized protein n=1 Tax=Smallanthus sonchifolius TaxID=185202 RepID=A0ACB9KAW7_9ASTR|nr:hypothetical protein L1987_03481 [Smallanthus sonchifolius]